MDKNFFVEKLEKAFLVNLVVLIGKEFDIMFVSTLGNRRCLVTFITDIWSCHISFPSTCWISLANKVT